MMNPTVEEVSRAMEKGLKESFTTWLNKLIDQKCTTSEVLTDLSRDLNRLEKFHEVVKQYERNKIR